MKEAVKEQMKAAKRNPKQTEATWSEEVKKKSFRVEGWLDEGLDLRVLLLISAVLRQTGPSAYSL